MKNETLFYAFFDSPVGVLHIYTDENGLLLGLDTGNALASQTGYTIKPGAQDEIKRQLESYFNKQLTHFRIPLRLEGTPFQLAVWQALTAVPYGSTITYQALAGSIGKPAAVRAVGNAVGANPVLIVVPCHRVIQSSGAMGGFSAGVDKKILLLTLEGIRIGE